MCEEEQKPHDDEADALEEEDGLVAHVVCNEEDWEKECKVGVCPNWENLVCNLEENKRGLFSFPLNKFEMLFLRLFDNDVEGSQL